MKIHSILFILISFPIILQSHLNAQSLSWKEAQKQGEATLDLHWFVSKPFIYHDHQDNLTGLEFEILTEFQKYLKLNHQVNLKLNWKESSSFSNILSDIESNNYPNPLWSICLFNYRGAQAKIRLYRGFFIRCCGFSFK